MATLWISRYSQSGTLTVSLSRTLGNTLDDSVLWNSPATGVPIESSVSFGFEPFQRSYYPGSPFVDQLKHGLQLDRSLQIAVVSNNESQNVWLRIEDATLTIVYKAKTIRIAQIDSAGFSFGEWGKWESNQWRYHPDSMLIRPTSTRHDTLLASQDYKPGTFQKYNVWRKNDAIDSVLNHNHLPSDANTSSWKAIFKPSKPATIQAQLIEGGATGGTIDFKDPWLVDNSDSKGPKNRGVNAIWHTVNSPFKPESSATYKGVFLNENPTWLPNLPNYSVGAPGTQTIGNFTSHFLSWTGTNTTFRSPDKDTTAVVFQQSNSTATAMYKAHLGSSLASATSTNGQRKLSVDVGPIDSKAALAYSSAGEIWLSESDASLSSLTNEFRVSDGSGSFGFPSVVATSSMGEPPMGEDASSQTPPHIGVVYQRRLSNNLGVTFREKRGGTWRNPVSLENYNFGVVDATPVIGRAGSETYPRLMFAWVRQEGLKSLVADWSTATNDWIWASTQFVPGTGFGDVRPSISNGNMNDAPLYLTFDNGDDISLQKFTNNWLTTPLTVPASVAMVSSASQVAADTRSSPDDVIHIVWEAVNPFIDPLVPVVMYQSSIGEDKWTAADEFVPEWEGFFRPTITYLEDGILVMAWDDGSSMYQARRAAGNESWTVDVVYDAQVGPNLPQPGSSSTLSSVRVLAAATSGPPYALQLTDEITGAFNRTAGVARVESGREINVAQRPQARSDPAPFFSLRIQSIALRLADGALQPLELAPVNSREPGLNEQNAWAYLATKQRNLTASAESLIVEASAVAKAPGSILGNGEEAIRFAFDLVDAQNDRVIRRIGSERVVRENGVLTFSIRERITDLAGRSILIRPRLKGLAQGRENMVYSLVHLHRVFRDSSASRPVGKPNVHQQAAQQIPTEFALRPSYPNPFNPSTQINFELPEASNVSLVMYDVLGRKVAELVNGAREEGYHSAIWDASGVASGVYFARFTALDGSGNVMFNKVSKLLLTK